MLYFNISLPVSFTFAACFVQRHHKNALNEIQRSINYVTSRHFMTVSTDIYFSQKYDRSLWYIVIYCTHCFILKWFIEYWYWQKQRRGMKCGFIDFSFCLEQLETNLFASIFAILYSIRSMTNTSDWSFVSSRGC